MEAAVRLVSVNLGLVLSHNRMVPLQSGSRWRWVAVTALQQSSEKGFGVPLERVVIAGFIVIGTLFAVVTVMTSWLLSPSKPSAEKGEPYECGEPSVGGPWVRFRAGYYVYALLYVIFDIETLFLYPWAVTFGRPAVGWFVFFEMVIFVIILLGGLIYAWKEGALKWR